MLSWYFYYICLSSISGKVQYLFFPFSFLKLPLVLVLWKGTKYKKSTCKVGSFHIEAKTVRCYNILSADQLFFFFCNSINASLGIEAVVGLFVAVYLDFPESLDQSIPRTERWLKKRKQIARIHRLFSPSPFFHDWIQTVDILRGLYWTSPVLDLFLNELPLGMGK